MENCDEPCLILENIKEVIATIISKSVFDLEEELNGILPIIIRTFKQIYNKNDLEVRSNSSATVDLVRVNFQIALNLMELTSDILDCVIKNGSVAFGIIPSTPISVAHIILLTFEHCKNGQKIYSTVYKSVTEILELFRKTQEVHSRFLLFLNAHLIVDYSNEIEVIAYKEILEVILQMSKTLSGINMKSLADNWKSFISIMQRPSSKSVKLFCFSAGLQTLTKEIDNNFAAIAMMEPLEPKEVNNTLKVTGFLVKVALKLFEDDLNVDGNYVDIVKFWTMVFSWHTGFFRTNNFPAEVVNSIDTLFVLCSESLENLLLGNPEFLKHFCQMHPQRSEIKSNFALLMFMNALIKVVPKLMEYEQKSINNFVEVSLLCFIFDLITDCYADFFYDYNSEFYEDLVINISVLILLFPHNFMEIESILLNCVIQENIWRALIAIDVWSLVLRYSSDNVCRSTFNALISKLEFLNLGNSDSLHCVRLKMLVQRIFQMLSIDVKNDEIAKYSPTTHLSNWKILNFRNIPLSHRYYIEFIISDISEKMDVFEGENCSSSDVSFLMENLDMISYVNFNRFHMFSTKIVPFIIRLWSFNITDLSLENKFLKHVLDKLIKVTAIVAEELTGEQFLTVFTQIKVAFNNVKNKFLVCAVLHAVAGKNFYSFPEKASMFSLMASLFEILLTDKNLLVVALALDCLIKIHSCNNYEIVVQKVIASSPKSEKYITDYLEKTAKKIKYDVQYLDKLQKYTYQPSSRSYQPVCKKIKLDDEVDIVINNLKVNIEKLEHVSSDVRVNEKHKADIKMCITKLKHFL